MARGPVNMDRSVRPSQFPRFIGSNKQLSCRGRIFSSFLSRTVIIVPRGAQSPVFYQRSVVPALHRSSVNDELRQHPPQAENSARLAESVYPEGFR
jgi:hypothetical protein